MRNDYCVYTHSLDDIVFYVGMGNKRRPRTFYKRTKYWNEYVLNREDEIKVDIIEDNLSKEQALKVELSLIKKYKRDLEGGTLVNKSVETPFNLKQLHENSKGRTRDVYWGDLISKSLKGKIPKNLKQLHENSKIRVGKYKDGLLIDEYDSIKEAGELNNINYRNIHSVCQGIRKTAGGFEWRKIINVRSEQK